MIKEETTEEKIKEIIKDIIDEIIEDVIRIEGEEIDIKCIYMYLLYKFILILG